MSLWLVRRLSRCNSLSLEQYVSTIPQHINCKLSSQLQKCRISQSRQSSTALSTSNNTYKSSNALLQSAECRAVKLPQSWNQYRNLSATGAALCKDADKPDKSTEAHARSQVKFSYRPDVDPSTTSIVLFPGQGTQFVGMGSELLKIPAVEDMYAAASEILGFDLKEASLNGPLKFLSRTQVQQPAVLVASLAAVEKLRQENPSALENCVATAGFSVGEITALTFAGALSFEDAVRLIKVRSEAMQEASEMVAGGMMTAFFGPLTKLGLCCSTAKEFCERKDIENAECKIASHLWSTCKVIAGSEEALQFLQENMKDFEIKRLKRLNVSGAFHTNHMKPAAVALKEVLKDMTIISPKIPVHSNIDGKPYSRPDQIRNNLPKQLYSSVQWEQTMHILYDRSADVPFPNTYECGPGLSLKAILKQVNVKAISGMQNIEA